MIRGIRDAAGHLCPNSKKQAYLASWGRTEYGPPRPQNHKTLENGHSRITQETQDVTTHTPFQPQPRKSTAISQLCTRGANDPKAYSQESPIHTHQTDRELSTDDTQATFCPITAQPDEPHIQAHSVRMPSNAPNVTPRPHLDPQPCSPTPRSPSRRPAISRLTIMFDTQPHGCDFPEYEKARKRGLNHGGSERHRSADLTIFSRSLYQLSYRAINRQSV